LGLIFTTRTHDLTGDEFGNVARIIFTLTLDFLKAIGVPQASVGSTLIAAGLGYFQTIMIE
jgi:hypothetical protein